MLSMIETNSKKIIVALFAVYIFLQYFFTAPVDYFGEYASYLLEVIVIVIAYLLIGKKSTKKYKLTSKNIALLIGTLVFGFVVFKFAIVFDFLIPFEMSQAKTILFLLVIAPVLEEAIFRYFAWHVFLIGNRRLAWGATSVIFALSHFYAIFSAPVEFYPFILYQTFFTLGLGLVCGYSIYRYNSLMGAILFHLSFNFGFYLAYLI